MGINTIDGMSPAKMAALRKAMAAKKAESAEKPKTTPGANPHATNTKPKTNKSSGSKSKTTFNKAPVNTDDNGNTEKPSIKKAAHKNRAFVAKKNAPSKKDGLRTEDKNAEPTDAQKAEAAAAARAANNAHYEHGVPNNTYTGKAFLKAKAARARYQESKDQSDKADAALASTQTAQQNAADNERRANEAAEAEKRASDERAAEANRRKDEENKGGWGIMGGINAISEAVTGRRVSDLFDGSSDDAQTESKQHSDAATTATSTAEAEAEKQRLLSKLSVEQHATSEKLDATEKKDKTKFESARADNAVVQTVNAVFGGDKAADIDEVVTTQTRITDDGPSIVNADAEYNHSKHRVELTRKFYNQHVKGVNALVGEGKLDDMGNVVGDPSSIADSKAGHDEVGKLAVITHESQHALQDKRGFLKANDNQVRATLAAADKAATAPGVSESEAAKIRKKGMLDALDQKLAVERETWRVQGTLELGLGKDKTVSKNADGSDLSESQLNQVIKDGMTGRKLSYGSYAGQALSGAKQISDVDLATSMLGANEDPGRKFPGRKFPGRKFPGRKFPGRKFP